MPQIERIRYHRICQFAIREPTYVYTILHTPIIHVIFKYQSHSQNDFKTEHKGNDNIQIKTQKKFIKPNYRYTRVYCTVFKFHPVCVRRNNNLL